MHAMTMTTTTHKNSQTTTAAKNETKKQNQQKKNDQSNVRDWCVHAHASVYEASVRLHDYICFSDTMQHVVMQLDVV
jgi:hypothetical protein